MLFGIHGLQFCVFRFHVELIGQRKRLHAAYRLSIHLDC